MLKVKEGIKLEELEKYGFRCYNAGVGWVSENHRLHVFADDKTIVNIDGDDILYDLITAGIVVKE